jgi:hypothetical protein
MTPNDVEKGKGKDDYLSKHHSPSYWTDTYRQEMEKLEKDAICFSQLLNSDNIFYKNFSRYWKVSQLKKKSFTAQFVTQWYKQQIFITLQGH